MKYLFFAIIFAVLVGCASDTLNEVTPTKDDPLAGLPDKGAIRLDKPAIGQRSYYVSFHAIRSNEHVNYTYTGDTLVIGITGLEADTWIIKEFLTEGSISKKNKSNSGTGYWKGYADSVFISNMKIDTDSIFISRPIHKVYNSFAFSGRNWAFQVSQVPDTDPLNPRCSPAFYYSSTVWIEYSMNYTQFSKTYDRINIHFDYRDMSTDGFGFMHAYEMQYGFVRSSWISYWELSKANGWDLVTK